MMVRNLEGLLRLKYVIYTITLYSLFAPTCSLQYVKLLTGYGGSSSNHTVFIICLLINILSDVQHLNLFN
jgi:hypothetical protein